MNVLPIEKRTAAEAVEQRLRTDILTGRIAVGDKLPPERELAVALGVNRITLRAALAKLVSAKLVTSHQGDGNRVLDFRVSSGLERLPDLASAFLDQPDTISRLVSDLLALRRTLLSECVAEACRTASNADLDALRRHIAQQWTRVGRRPDFMEGDFQFARLLVRASGNLAYELVLNTIVQFAKQNPLILQHLYLAPETHCRGYEAVLALLDARDGDFARNAVREGLMALDTVFLDNLRYSYSATLSKQQTTPHTNPYDLTRTLP